MITEQISEGKCANRGTSARPERQTSFKIVTWTKQTWTKHHNAAFKFKFYRSPFSKVSTVKHDVLQVVILRNHVLQVFLLGNLVLQVIILRDHVLHVIILRHNVVQVIMPRHYVLQVIILRDHVIS